MDGSLAREPVSVGPPPAGPPAAGEIVVRRTTPGRPRKQPPRPPGKPRPPRGTKPPTRAGTLRPPMEKFVIEGGVPLAGTIVPAGNKNGALPILAACLLTDEEVVLTNVPRIADVETMMELLETLGAQVEWRGPNAVAVDASGVVDGEVDRR